MGTRLLRLAPAVVLAATAAGCGHGGTKQAATSTAAATTASAATTEPASGPQQPATTDAAPPSSAAPVTDAEAAVIRRWSAALNENDNAAAARVFADDAVIYGTTPQPLGGIAAATEWNAGFPCGGRIVDLRHVGRLVVATFRLTERPQHTCDAPGGLAGAAYDVRDGAIHGFGRVPPYGGGLDVPSAPAASVPGVAL